MISTESLTTYYNVWLDYKQSYKDKRKERDLFSKNSPVSIVYPRAITNRFNLIIKLTIEKSIETCNRLSKFLARQPLNDFNILIR